MKEQLEFMLESHQATCCFLSSSPPDIKPNLHEVKINNNLQPEEFSELPSCNTSCSGSNTSTKDSESLQAQISRLNRPNTLQIFTEPKPRPSSLHFKVENANNGYMKQQVTEIAGIPITTPSNGVPFNFDSLMDGGTGLTPVSTPIVPTCSSQQRNNLASSYHHNHHNHHIAAVDLSSPDSNPSKLVSL